MFIYIILRTNIRKIKQNKWISLGFMFYWDMTDILIDFRMYANTRLKFGYMRFYLYLCHVIDDFACR